MRHPFHYSKTTTHANMGFTNIIVLGLAAYVLAEPIPQATTDPGSAETGAAYISDTLASLSSVDSVLAGAPTLAPSVLDALILAIPTGLYTGQECQTTTPAWYYSLPADIKSELSSYDSAYETWYAVHSSELPDTPQTLPANICAGTFTYGGSGRLGRFDSGNWQNFSWRGD